MPFTFKEIPDLLKAAYSEWSADNASRLGAALAYYAVFSLAPLLLIVIGVASLVWGNQSGAAQAQVMAEMQRLIGPSGAEMISTMLESASRPGGGSVWATVAGAVVLLFGATGVFVQLQGALNTIWNVRPAPGRGLWNFVAARLLSFGMILGVGFLLLVSLVVSAGISAMEGYLQGVTPGTQVLARVLGVALSLGLVTLLFALIYRYLPDVEIAWRDVWIGAAITALLFTLGKLLLGLYLGRSGAASAFGAAGSLVVLLIWVYYSAQIVFFGAELTQVYARRHGSQIRPGAHAVWLDAPEED